MACRLICRVPYLGTCGPWDRKLSSCSCTKNRQSFWVKQFALQQHISSKHSFACAWSVELTNNLNPHTQRIEAWWSQLRRHKTGWWIDAFQKLLCDGEYDPGNESHRFVLKKGKLSSPCTVVIPCIVFAVFVHVESATILCSCHCAATFHGSLEYALHKT